MRVAARLPTSTQNLDLCRASAAGQQVDDDVGDITEMRIAIRVKTGMGMSMPRSRGALAMTAR